MANLFKKIDKPLCGPVFQSFIGAQDAFENPQRDVVDYINNWIIIGCEDFTDFLLSKIDDKIIQEGVQKLNSDSKSFQYLKDEEDLYSVDDLKERYR